MIVHITLSVLKYGIFTEFIDRNALSRLSFDEYFHCLFKSCVFPRFLDHQISCCLNNRIMYIDTIIHTKDLLKTFRLHNIITGCEYIICTILKNL